MIFYYLVNTSLICSIWWGMCWKVGICPSLRCMVSLLKVTVQGQIFLTKYVLLDILDHCPFEPTYKLITLSSKHQWVFILKSHFLQYQCCILVYNLRRKRMKKMSFISFFPLGSIREEIIYWVITMCQILKKIQNIYSEQLC